ncbi:hypothetical protein N657DRAFT_550492, partial [Parathielavia appendiculata]
MDESQGYQLQEWTMLFVNSVQAERRRREEHTTDTWRSIQEYAAAADRKIKEALGSEGPALRPV